MIKNIEHINSKSFDNYSSDEKFNLTNIVFGTNGSGKTALSIWLKKELPDNTRLFNSDYVEQNIVAVNEISGVKLTVGKAAVNVEENIERVKFANDQIKSQGIQINKDYEAVKKELFQILNTTLQHARQQFELTKNIKQKQKAADDPVNAINQWFNDINDTLPKIGSSKELEQEKQLLERRFQNLNTIFNYKQEKYDWIKKSLEQPVMVPSNVVSQQIAQWIKSGTHLHNMSSKEEVCQFCGNIFDASNISKIIQEKTSSEHAILTQSLTNFLQELDTARNKVTHLPEGFQSEDIINTISNIKNLVNQKIENSNQNIKIDLSLIQTITQFDSMLSTNKNELSLKLRNINRQLNEVELVAKSWIGSQLKNNATIESLENKLYFFSSKIKELRKIYKSNEKWISEQQVSNSSLKPFRDLVNHEFDLLGLDFKIEILEDNAHYLIKHKNLDIVITTTNLSEGECRLLGFLHFYYDLFDSVDETISSDTSLILIDDPITSMDSDNRYYLTELINDFIKKSIELTVQLFIFTHSSLDFHNFGYSNKSQISFWKVRKNVQRESEILHLKSEDIQNYSDYYQANFKDVYEFASLGRTNLPDGFIQFGNKARLVLESHARTHYKLEYATSTVIKKIQEYYDVPDSKYDSLKHSLDIINSLSHGMTFADEYTLSAREVQQSVRFMLSMLYNKDPFHVKQMAGNLFNSHTQLQWLTPPVM
ncbi:AAA family ATPase [Leuconostoc gelidum subsp. gasicomitatum]|uniref:AAA family ATPase n=1 Tax=Leuconostoc gasicomitatum TaxID=115778 RepID=UPI001CC50FC2|nr:AAA family ATPase [Leuconostoc gasicomitatum]MBZ5984136.1 AAA family ATPase [Leuconostoc gasicomitatum]